MSKLKLAVIFGGESYEYGVSLQSSTSVLQHLDSNKYDVIKVGIDPNGSWYYYDGPIELIEKDQWNQKDYAKPCCLSFIKGKQGILVEQENGVELVEIDLAFPILHGRNGEDGSVQGALQLAHIPCVGCGVMASSLCMDKNRSHRLVESYGIKVPAFIELKENFKQEDVDQFVKEVGCPLFVKPVKAGSSYGITCVEDLEELPKAIAYAFEYDDVVVIEQGISGFEVGCAVLGNQELTTGCVDEIELSQGFFNFEEKYTLKTSKIHVPARISEELSEQVKETACKIYQILGCEGFARVDLFINENQEIIFNEVNTIPGFTSHSRYPSMMKEAGISFEEVIDRVIGLKGCAPCKK